MMNLTELFCNIDDFWIGFKNIWQLKLLEANERKRMRPTALSISEIMTIIVLFHQTGYRNFKTFYVDYVCRYLHKDFPELVSYNRFVALMPSILVPLCAYLQLRKGQATGISYVDSTPIAVCKNLRINRNKVFSGLAARGKTSTGWFFGFKLHLIVNDKGDLLNFAVTPGNVDDRKPLEKLAQCLSGKIFGDRGYLSKELFSNLLQHGLQLITTIKKNMKNKLLPIIDKILLRKRFIIETINDQLKNISQIEHSRHRSITNFMVNLVAGLIAYTHQLKKPSIKLYGLENCGLNSISYP